jgi:phosphopantothenoylcysteine decarboxylase/phosphopantothenate--cysteine ligase
MGVALAAAAWRRGAEVALVHGPLAVPLPLGGGICSTAVETTAEMAEAVARELPQADILVMAAAPADFRPVEVASAKRKKTGSAPAPIALEETPDILATSKALRPTHCITVGFALETDDLEANAAKKLAAKSLDLVVANSAREAGAGFGYDTNRVTILARDGTMDALPLLSKAETADRILDRIEALL